MSSGYCKILKFVFSILLCAGYVAAPVLAQQPSAAAFDDEDIAIRGDSVVIEGWEFEDFEVRVPGFINLRKNNITMNGADWSSLRHELSRHDTVPFTIVHIGDSHLQADISTGYTRQQMQFDYGDAGRGLIVPLRLSRTNEPVDYFFKSSSSWAPLKFMSANWPRPMGFTGASLKTTQSPVEITVGSRVTDTYSTFSDIWIFHGGDVSIERVTLDDGSSIENPVVAYENGVAKIYLPKPTGSATIRMSPADGFTLQGAYLSGARPGLFYNVIGNNGATYSSYNRISGMGRSVSVMHPNLIIISLGTNEAFGRVDHGRMIDAIDKLVNDLRRNNPKAQLLLVTPMECQRKGSINTNVKIVSDIIAQYGKDHHIAVYDWYHIAGGDGASRKWIADGLYGGDRIHHTVKGYRLQGFMLYQALTNALLKN